jgi:hypothetical protein
MGGPNLGAVQSGRRWTAQCFTTKSHRLNAPTAMHSSRNHAGARCKRVTISHPNPEESHRPSSQFIPERLPPSPEVSVATAPAPRIDVNTARNNQFYQSPVKRRLEK